MRDLHFTNMNAMELSNGDIVTCGMGYTDNIVLWPSDMDKCLFHNDDYMGYTVYGLAELSPREIIYSSSDGMVYLWTPNPKDNTAQISFRMPDDIDITKLVLLPNQLLAGITETDNKIYIWNVNTKGVGPTIIAGGGSDVVVSICGMKDGRLVSGSDRGELNVWIYYTGSGYQQQRRNVPYLMRRSTCMTQLKSGAMAIGMSPDEDDKALILLWDVDKGNTAEIMGHTKKITSIVELETGVLLSGSEDGTIRAWYINAGRSQCLLLFNNKIHRLSALHNGSIMFIHGTNELCFSKTWRLFIRSSNSESTLL